MEIHKAFQEKFSPDLLVEKTQPLPVYYGNVCLREAEQLLHSTELYSTLLTIPKLVYHRIPYTAFIIL